jgi:hypothetical protein
MAFPSGGQPRFDSSEGRPVGSALQAFDDVEQSPSASSLAFGADATTACAAGLAALVLAPLLLLFFTNRGQLDWTADVLHGGVSVFAGQRSAVTDRARNYGPLLLGTLGQETAWTQRCLPVLQDRGWASRTPVGLQGSYSRSSSSNSSAATSSVQRAGPPSKRKLVVLLLGLEGSGHHTVETGLAPLVDRVLAYYPQHYGWAGAHDYTFAFQDEFESSLEAQPWLLNDAVQSVVEGQNVSCGVLQCVDMRPQPSISRHGYVWYHDGPLLQSVLTRSKLKSSLCIADAVVSSGSGGAGSEVSVAHALPRSSAMVGGATARPGRRQVRVAVCACAWNRGGKVRILREDWVGLQTPSSYATLARRFTPPAYSPHPLAHSHMYINGLAGLSFWFAASAIPSSLLCGETSPPILRCSCGLRSILQSTCSRCSSSSHAGLPCSCPTMPFPPSATPLSFLRFWGAQPRTSQGLHTPRRRL